MNDDLTVFGYSMYVSGYFSSVLGYLPEKYQEEYFKLNETF